MEEGYKIRYSIQILGSILKGITGENPVIEGDTYGNNLQIITDKFVELYPNAEMDGKI